MPAPRKYPQELRERAVRLVNEAMAEDASLSLNAAVIRIGPKVGVVPDTLVRVRPDVSVGVRPDVSVSGGGHDAMSAPGMRFIRLRSR